VTDGIPTGAAPRREQWAPWGQWLPIVGFGALVLGAGLCAGRPVEAASRRGGARADGARAGVALQDTR